MDILEKMANDQLHIAGRLDAGTRISPIQFAGIVMTFESSQVTQHQRSMFKPIFVHHVVLIPLNHGTIGTGYTQRFVLAHCLGTGLNTALGGNCHVSVSITPCLKWDTYDAEAKYRRKYGITARLNQDLVRIQKIPPATSFSLYDENPITFKSKGLCMFSKDMNKAYEYWENKLVKEMENICIHFEPIIID